jgi:hypothetical protein
MQRGALVTATHLPAWGVGVVEFVAPNGMRTVSFEIGKEGYTEDFHALELEPAKPTLVRTA